MKFHLSTMLLAMVIVALGLGWYLDHHDPRRTEIVGTWHFPYPNSMHQTHDAMVTLELRDDGTFRKRHHGPFHDYAYEGRYNRNAESLMTFHITSLVTQPKQTKPQDTKYYARCALDPAGYLLVEIQQWEIGVDDSGHTNNITAESYERSK